MPSPQRTLRVGLTGGIASGKSTAARLFARRGVPVIDTDEIARAVVQPGEPGLEAIVAAFGPGVLDGEGALDRRRMRDLVFASPEARGRIEDILHPAIRAEMLRLAGSAGGPYQILVIPLLVEAGLEADLDRILVVDCPESTQIERLAGRDGESAESARRILAAQHTRAARLAHADDVILNDRDVGFLDAQVARLHEEYLSLARGWGD